jgi:hypothetical protein
MQAPLPLDYAPLPPWHRRRRLRRWIILVLLAAALMPALWYRQPLWRRANLLYYGWQCGRYTAPADQLIFSTDPADLARLGSDPRYAIARRFNDTTFCLVASPPKCWTRYYRAGLNSRQFRPPGNAIAFLHTLRHKSGPQWLVAFDWSCTTQHSVTLRTNVVSAEIEQGRRQCQGVTYSLVGMHLPLRVFAGQPDPTDPSHFTIRYELAGRAELIDGFLTDDNNIKLIVPAVERLRTASAAARQ